MVGYWAVSLTAQSPASARPVREKVVLLGGVLSSAAKIETRAGMSGLVML